MSVVKSNPIDIYNSPLNHSPTKCSTLFQSNKDFPLKLKSLVINFMNFLLQECFVLHALDMVINTILLNSNYFY